jgi:SAM-dependent methyltransferase
MSTKASASNVEWAAYARQDYGASHDVAAGLSEWAVIKDHLRQYGLERIETSVEIGCGGGRLTNAIAGDVPHHNALDLEQARIDQARSKPNGHRATFHLVSDPVIPLADNSVDLGVSTHVFQHIDDPGVVSAYFAELFRVLRPGGCIFVHLPMIGAHGTTGDWWEVTARRLKEGIKLVALPLTRQLIRRKLPLPWRIDFYRVFAYPRVKSELSRLGYGDIEMRLLPYGEGHSYVLARKPARAITGA